MKPHCNPNIIHACLDRACSNLFSATFWLFILQLFIMFKFVSANYFVQMHVWHGCDTWWTPLCSDVHCRNSKKIFGEPKIADVQILKWQFAVLQHHKTREISLQCDLVEPDVWKKSFKMTKNATGKLHHQYIHNRE